MPLSDTMTVGAVSTAASDNATRPRLLFLVNEDRFFWSHRRCIALAAMKAGYEVSVAAEVTGMQAEIEAAGIRVYPIPRLRGLHNPIREFKSLARIIGIYRRIRPDVVHHVTIKNIFLGTLAARLTGVSGIVNAFSGLGYVFYGRTWKAFFLRTMICTLMRITLRGSHIRYILQNDDDLADLERLKILTREQSVLIRGSGVDPEEFQPTHEATSDGPLNVLLATRLLWSKGLAQYVAAARALKSQGLNARFIIVGRLDPRNPDHVPPKQMQEWVDEGAVEWWGHRSDMPKVLAGADIVCLPALHGEGLPRVLLEAAACGCPVVASDVRGCREICRDNLNGLLVPPDDVASLTEAFSKLLQDQPLRERMGQAGRAIVVREFTAEQVAQQTLEVYSGLHHLQGAISVEVGPQAAQYPAAEGRRAA